MNKIYLPRPKRFNEFIVVLASKLAIIFLMMLVIFSLFFTIVHGDSFSYHQSTFYISLGFSIFCIIATTRFNLLFRSNKNPYIFSRELIYLLDINEFEMSEVKNPMRWDFLKNTSDENIIQRKKEKVGNDLENYITNYHL